MRERHILDVGTQVTGAGYAQKELFHHVESGAYL